ncbi:hypothetical protein Aph01nite_67270 [Acrocarpospora phusangensis]|uniref:Uncharacterized protein n=1 Tax=Acrocarpospora phusangensis TaxID=1070424 RepID=A0A919QGA1_9ACTN|nr:DUF6203 family protein [Acrocarpospora phusangensis]GIH28417.1 hypothetical protein Aph01nite_67270 [Acrocarpospora phusangensis]
MKRIFQLFVTRWLSKTPLGLVVLGVAWWIMRKKRGENEKAPVPPRKDTRRKYAARR